jgi:lipoprotein-anchoring transpeptidase ErfK/SrfK
MGEAVTTGPVVMVVSITEQRGYVYRNGILIGATTVSTGRPGHLTPAGVFTVLQKQKEHRSTIYDGAPMTYMERLTWGGIALHAGGLPGHPESHGCIHLPAHRRTRYPGGSERGCQNQNTCRLRGPTQCNTDAGGDIVCDS